MHDARRWLRHRGSRREERWLPFLAVQYLTYACDFRCPYCSDGEGVPYPRKAGAVLSAARLDALLARIRKACNHLELTGGEPLLHPEIGQILSNLPRHRFGETVLTTNGWHLGSHLEAVERSITTLVVSLDTLDPQRAAQWYGKGEKTLDVLLGRIREASRLKRTELVLSMVAIPDNLDEVPALLALSQELGATFACYPQLCGTRVPEGLLRDPRLGQAFAFLLAQKRKGAKVQTTAKALEWLRDGTSFECRPLTIVAVAPDGDVYYPCLEIGKVAGNLFEEESLDALLAKGKELHGPIPRCAAACPSACSLGFASILSHPATMLEEGLCRLKGALR